MAFGADFELDASYCGSIRINCHCHFIQRSCSKGRYLAQFLQLIQTAKLELLIISLTMYIHNVIIC